MCCAGLVSRGSRGRSCVQALRPACAVRAAQRPLYAHAPHSCLPRASGGHVRVHVRRVALQHPQGCCSESRPGYQN